MSEQTFKSIHLKPAEESEESIQALEKKAAYARQHGFQPSNFQITYDLVQTRDEDEQMKADLEEAKSVLLDRKSHAQIKKYQELENDKIEEAEKKAKIYQKFNGFMAHDIEIVE